MRPIQIYIDADACPVKAEVYRVAERYGLKVFVVANSYIGVARVSTESMPKIDMILSRHGLERLGCGQLPAHHRQQRLQQRGLLPSREQGGAHQRVQHRQEHTTRQGGGETRLPGDRQRDHQIDHRIEEHRRHFGAVLE